MGRHFEVRAASMAATAKKKSAIYMRASKEIYMAAKKGVPDPNSNLALRAAIDKYRKKMLSIERLKKHKVEKLLTTLKVDMKLMDQLVHI